MTQHARLVVAVDSRDVTRARNSINQLPAATRKAEAAAGSLTGSFRKLGGVLATYFSVREILRSAEAYTTITNRLKLVTNGSEELAQAQADLFRIAQSGRQPLSETAELYQRIATNQEQLGLTGAGVARVTETISKSLAVSGTSAASAAGALTQLGQAFASGQLRGEELNSVLENAPALAQALAEGMGVTVGQLRALGADGELTARKVVDALIKQSDAMDEAFSTMAPTVSGAVTTVRNSLTQLIGRMDESSDSSAAAAREIMDLADLLSDPETIQSAQQLAGGIATLTGWLVQAAGASADFARWFGEAMAAAFNGPALDDIVRVEDRIASLEYQITRVQGAMAEEGTAGAWLQNLTGATERGKAGLEQLRAELEFYRQARDRFYTQPPGSSTPPPPPSTGTPPLRTGGTSGGLTDPADAKKLANTYRSMVATLERQRDLYGQTSEAARIRYEIENGALKGIAGEQIKYLEGLASELDNKRDLTEQEELRIQLLRETGQLRAANDAQFQLEYAAKIAAYEEAGNQAAADRLRTLRQIREIQMNAEQAPGTVEGVTRAPQSQGVDAMFGGATGELIKLQEQSAELEAWRQTELEKQQGFLETKAINEEVYAERVRNIHQQHQAELSSLEQARTQVSLAASEQMFGSLASMAATFAGEQSGIYRAMFAVQKAAAIAQSIVAIQQGIAMAAANPWPANIGAMASVAAATAGIVSNIAAVGMAHDGIDSIPKEGTWLLDKGERVVDRRTNADLKEYLAGGKGGGGAPVININASVTVEAQPGMSEAEARRHGQNTAGAIDAVLMSRIEKESRPGGLLWRLYGGGR